MPHHRFQIKSNIALQYCNSKNSTISNAVSLLICTIKITSRNPTIFNIVRWVTGSMGWLSHWPIVWCLIFFIISFKILCKYSFNLLFFYIFTKIKIKNFECPKSKPLTHCFIFNLSQWYFNHQMLGRWDDQPSNPAYYTEDCRILRLQIKRLSENRKL